MFPDNLAISAIDVLNYHQKKKKIFVPARNFTAIVLRLKSSGKYICNNITIPFAPVSICITPAGLSYERIATNEENVFTIYLNMLNFVMKDIEIVRVLDGEKYKKLFEKAFEIKRKNDIGSMFIVNAVIYEILSELKRETGFTSKSKDNRIMQAAEYMRHNFGNPDLSIEQVVNKSYASATYFRQEFNKVYGTSPKDYLDTLRMQHATFLLETGNFTTKEISERCGFSDVGYFRTIFKKKIGTTLTQYKKNKIEN